jgi:anthranilate phosphoribosyltransferase
MHSAMKYVQPARRDLRLRTVFNLLGPLTNPANASAQVVGVYSESLVAKLAEALCQLGLQRALVVHKIIREILEGVRSPHRDIILLNSAAALVAAGKIDTIIEGVPLAADSIDSGAARMKLEALVAFTNQKL